MEFGVLGPVEVWRDGRPADAGHARQRAVLAVLVLDAGRAVPLEVLIDRVWGEQPPRSVRNVVYGYVARLKALIAGGRDPGVDLSRRSGGYLLQARPDRVDVARFRRLVADASATGDDHAAAVLGEAVALWRGPALAGLDSPWLNAMRARLELERAAAVLDLNEIRLRRGEHGTLVLELAAQAAAAPTDERLIGQLMLALYRCGRQAEALRCYERTRRHLADELGADPSLDLRALHEQVLRADQALATPGPAGPAGPPGPPTPRELPADVTAFTGRAAELAELDRLLGGGRPIAAAVISALSGTAGVGKTALAVHWAHRAAERFPDGQLYVNLRGYDPGQPMTAAEALTGFLRALGVPDSDIPADPDQRATRYRSLLAGRRMLMVLDNARHSEQVRPLLPGGAGCAVVVTSRDALAGLVARDGAVRLDLGLLPLHEAVNLLRELIGDRAGAEPDAAAALARRCSRLPLALRVAAELATARSGVPLAALVAELADLQRRLDLLDAGGDPRTAVRAVFSWSYRRLDPATARAFRLAGHQPGSDFDPCAAAALTGTTVDQARQMLDVLARAHLIHSTAPGRYAMHDLLRAYARDLAAEHDSDEDLQAALTRICDHHIRTTAGAPPENWLDEQLALLIAAAADCGGHRASGHATRLDLTLLRRANAILETASAVIAAALDNQQPRPHPVHTAARGPVAG
jgi:DNA-binding SARP family transcriptional activator